jgi:pentafunctional AROM polypeptide
MEPQEIQHGKEKIFVGSHYISRIPGYFKKIVPKANRFVLLTDSNVYRHYGAEIEKSLRAENLDYIIRVLEPGEHTKCRKVKEEIEDWMFQLGCLRDSCVVGMKVIANNSSTFIRNL